MLRDVQRADTDEAKAKAQQAWDTWIPAFEEQLSSLQELAKEYEDQIYAANQPQPHNYQIMR